MSPPLAGLPGHPPALWRRGAESPAQRIWGADFELWGPDCPLGPGVWVDRIGGLEAACVGTGDWYRDANGYAGVTKADTCYVEWDTASGIDGKLAETTFFETRTVAMLVDGWGPREDTKQIPLVSHRNRYGAGTSEYIENVSCVLNIGTATAPASYVGMNINAFGVTGYVRPIGANRTSVQPVLWARATRMQTSPQLVESWGLHATLTQWVTSLNSYVAIDPATMQVQRQRIFHRVLDSTYWITNATARDVRFLSIASAPGLVDPELLKAWANLYGIWT